MRITGGTARGVKLSTPQGRLIRPSLDRVRESLFQIILNYFSQDISETKLLDLFAGTGALGLEALSRGASTCVFVEKDIRAIKLIKKNIKTLGVDKRSLIIKSDVRRLSVKNFKHLIPFDIILADPPYNKGFGEIILKKVCKLELLSKQGVLVIEESKISNLPNSFKDNDCKLICDQVRRYGDTALYFYIKEGMLDGR